MKKEKQSQFYKYSQEKGISLIMLVITIIVVIILAGAVILSLSQNNPINTANQAVFKSNVSGYNDELGLWITSQYVSNSGDFDSYLINKTGTQIKNEGIIPSMKASDVPKFEIQQGRLVFVGENTTEADWARSVGIEATNATPEPEDTTPPIVTATNGGSTTTSITIIGLASDGGSGINASSYQYSKDNGTTWTTASSVTTYTFTGLTSGTYMCKVKVADNTGNVGTSDTISIVVTYQQANAAVTEGNTSTPLIVNSTINGQSPSYNNPLIPAGFFAVNTTDANWSNITTNWNNGLVIQDVSGNQFVWVPIYTGVEDYQDVPFGKLSGTNPSYEDITSTGFVTPTYGFYIGRYEGSFDYNGGSIRVASKKSTNATTSSWLRDSGHTGYLWNFITHTEAKSYAEAMKTSYGYTTVGTSLLTGTAWDTVMKWIQNSGINVANDSSSWGNYVNVSFTYEWPTPGTKSANSPSLLNTGAAIRNRAKNIYDLAGNVCEWTLEKQNSDVISRGGLYLYSGVGNMAAAHYNDPEATIASIIGLRALIYIL